LFAPARGDDDDAYARVIDGIRHGIVIAA